MLLFADLELHPMKNSDRAWIWAGINYAEDPSGQQETLAVRFKSIELFNEFGNKVAQCIQVSVRYLYSFKINDLKVGRMLCFKLKKNTIF